MARKPLAGTVAANVLRYGTGGINVDACRIGTEPRPVMVRTETVVAASSMSGTSTGATPTGDLTTLGRWPANLIHDGSDEVTALFPEAARFFYTAKASRKDREEGLESLPLCSAGEATDRVDGSAGLNSPRAGASRTNGARNHHPTVKPTSLMRYLCRLVTPRDGIVLDPFMGSGSTGKAAILEGFRFIGIDLEPEYVEIARARCEWAMRKCCQGELL